MHAVRISRLAGILVSAVGIVVASSVGAQEPRGAFFLDRGLDSAMYVNSMTVAPLPREFLRQAVLAAAREDLGLTVGDAWIGDVRPTDAPDLVLDVVTSPGKSNHVEILRGVAPHQRSVAQLAMEPMIAKRPFDPALVLTNLDQLVRSELTPKLAELLAAAKPTDVARPSVDAEALQAVVARVEPLVNELTFPTQFAAARELHRQIKQHGEAPELVGLLVRAYANLGLLTEPYFSSMQRTFRARALVYAQRWAVRDSQSLRSLAHRAYAWFAAGFPKSALDDLAELRRQADEGLGGASDVPAWTAIIDAACRYQLSTLAETPVDDPHHQLAYLLRYRDITQTAETPRINTGAIETYNAAPEAYVILDNFEHVIDQSYHYENTDVDHRTTRLELYQAQRLVLGQQLYVRLKAMSDLPPAVAELLADYDPEKTEPGSDDEYVLRGKVISALLKTPPADDVLTWPLLGRIVQEVSFRQAMESHERDEAANGDLPKNMLPLVAEHWLRPYFQARDSTGPNRDEALLKLAAGIDRDDIDVATVSLLSVLAYGDGAFETLAARTLRARYADASVPADRTARELNQQLGRRHFEADKYSVKDLLHYDPYSPNGINAALKYLPDEYADRMESWKHLAVDFPQIEALLAKQLAAAATPAEQEEKLLALFKKSPEPEILYKLIQLQLDRNDVDAWEATMRDFIARAAKTDDAMKACVGAAATLVNRRMFERAVPFLEAAQEQHYYPAERTAVAVYEGLQNWDLAEKSAKNWAESDFDDRCEWYFFCKRTGQGDRDGALTLAQANIDVIERSIMRGETVALFALLNRETERALSPLRTTFVRFGDPLWGMYAAMVYDELGQTAERDAFLKEVREKGPKFRIDHSRTGRVRTGILELGKLLEADLARGGKADFDAAAIEKLRTDYPADRGDFDCLLDLYYDRHGRADLAAQSWLKCMASTKIVSFSRTLSGYRLWDRAVTPVEYRDALQGRTPAAKQE